MCVFDISEERERECDDDSDATAAAIGRMKGAGGERKQTIYFCQKENLHTNEANKSRSIHERKINLPKFSSLIL